MGFFWVTISIVTFLSCQVLQSDAQRRGKMDSHFSCPTGWIPYSKDAPVTCVQMGSEFANGLERAHMYCLEMNASLIILNTEVKRLFMLDMMTSSEGAKFYLGLLKFPGEDGLQWKTKDGNKGVASSLPKSLRRFSWSHESYNNKYMGLLMSPDGTLLQADYRRSRNYGRYICEKIPACHVGYFSPSCDKVCHCHGETCDSSDRDVTCIHGCQVGWMGTACDMPKQDASVKYTCVKSPDQGEYVHIRIHTKLTKYETIAAVDRYGHQIQWCNTTEISFNTVSSVQTIKIYIDEETKKEMAFGSCAGDLSNSTFSWQIKIQEKNGFVSRNDQTVKVTCNQSREFDTLSVSASASIQTDEPHVTVVDRHQEGVDLKVVDAYTGLPVEAAPAGSSVILRVRYGLDETNDASSVWPYDCEAFSSNDLHLVKLLDSYGCALPGSIISEFSKNGTQSFITKPFPLVHFPGSKNLKFRCSYKLCYDKDPCQEGCRPKQVEEIDGDGNTWWMLSNQSSRRKRSTRSARQILTSSVLVETSERNIHVNAKDGQ